MTPAISAETWQERAEAMRLTYLNLNLNEISWRATASMLDDAQARQIEHGKRLARIEEMVRPSVSRSVVDLTDAEFDAFAEAMEDTGEPTEALKKAAVFYKEWQAKHPPIPDPRDAVVEAARKVPWDKVRYAYDRYLEWKDISISSHQGAIDLMVFVSELDALSALDREGV